MQKSKNDITSQVQKATRYDSTKLAEKIFKKLVSFEKNEGFKIILVTCHTEQKFFRDCIFLVKTKTTVDMILKKKEKSTLWNEKNCKRKEAT